MQLEVEVIGNSNVSLMVVMYTCIVACEDLMLIYFINVDLVILLMSMHGIPIAATLMV